MARVNVANVWIVVVQVEDGRQVSTRGGGGSIMAHLTLGSEGGAVMFGSAWEGNEPVERNISFVQNA